MKCPACNKEFQRHLNASNMRWLAYCDNKGCNNEVARKGDTAFTPEQAEKDLYEKIIEDLGED